MFWVLFHFLDGFAHVVNLVAHVLVVFNYLSRGFSLFLALIQGWWLWCFQYLAFSLILEIRLADECLRKFDLPGSERLFRRRCC